MSAVSAFESLSALDIKVQACKSCGLQNGVGLLCLHCAGFLFFLCHNIKDVDVPLCSLIQETGAALHFL